MLPIKNPCNFAGFQINQNVVPRKIPVVKKVLPVVCVRGSERFLIQRTTQGFARLYSLSNLPLVVPLIRKTASSERLLQIL